MELEASSVIERLHALAQDAWRSIRTTPRHLMLVLLGTATSFAALLMFVGVVASIRGLPVSLFLSDPATILPLVAALACFGASALIDQVAITLPLQLLWEDGFKFLGIGCWLVYFFYAATAAVTGSRRSMPQNTSGGDVS